MDLNLQSLIVIAIIASVSFYLIRKITSILIQVISLLLTIAVVGVVLQQLGVELPQVDFIQQIIDQLSLLLDQLLNQLGLPPLQEIISSL
ncbi:hypothetical protein [Halanaerobaculum tunisiense]